MADGSIQARGAVQINLHGAVGEGITLERVSAELARAGKGPVTISLHSYGGDALAGIAIHNMLARHPGPVTVVVEGVAASAASLIAMAGNRIVMPENALLMIHEAWGGATGDAGRLRDQANVLETVSSAYRQTYAKRTGRTEDEVAAWMAAETWFTAAQAVEAGLADEVIPARDVQALAGAQTALASYRNPPAAFAALIKGKEPSSMDGTTNTTPPAQAAASLDDIKAVALRNGLGAEFVLQQLEAGATIEAATSAAIDTVAAAAPAPVAPRATIGTSWDAPRSIADRAAEAFASRVTGRPVSEPAREFMGMSFTGVARRLLAASGSRLRPDAAPSMVINAALTTSDFPNFFTGTQQRILADRLAASPGAARMICARRTARDFRSGTFLEWGGVRELERIYEGGPVKNGAPAERTQTFQVLSWGRTVEVSRQMFVNDDMSVLDAVNLFSNAVVATEAAAFATMFAVNGAGWGPTLSDGQPLFHSSHNNVAAGTMGTAGISAGRLVMRAQTDASGNLVAPEPRMILTGPAGETAAEQALNATAVAVAESGRPVFSNRLSLAVEPRLAGAPWFLFADPTVRPVLAIVFLEGSEGVPIITRHENSSFDGLSWKLVHDFVVAPMGFVGAVRLTGA